MAIVQYNHRIHQRYNLTEHDLIYYFFERTSSGFDGSPNNGKILNFKKDISKRDRYEWKFKIQAIQEFASDLIREINPTSQITIIPAPTSNPRGSENFDDRIDQVVNLVQSRNGLCKTEYALDTSDTIQSSHMGGSRDIAYIKEHTIWNGFQVEPSSTVILIDDVLTTGAHFKAWKEIILERDPRVTNVIGVCWALHVWPELDVPPIAWPDDFEF